MNQIGSVLPTRANDLFTDEEIEEIVSSEQGLPNGNQVSRGDEALEENESPTLSPQSPTLDIPKLKSAIHAMKDQLDGMLRMLNGEQSSVIRSAEPDTDVLDGGERIIEGVFNGEKMVGPDGKEYAVSPNYASKSKIVEGDMMKLTITNNGKFIFKQIGPVERKTISGELVQDPDSQHWGVLVDGKVYKILKASVTFYHAKSGDEVFILVPDDGQSAWGAVDNIISS